MAACVHTQADLTVGWNGLQPNAEFVEYTTKLSKAKLGKSNISLHLYVEISPPLYNPNR